MMWINQQPKKYSTGWFNIEIISPWREKDIARFIAAAEVATGEYFNPLNPEDLAKTLRSLNS
jgi:UDPglucose--hexose-1-phosphate uridylyltransferase